MNIDIFSETEMILAGGLYDSYLFTVEKYDKDGVVTKLPNMNVRRCVRISARLLVTKLLMFIFKN